MNSLIFAIINQNLIQIHPSIISKQQFKKTRFIFFIATKNTNATEVISTQTPHGISTHTHTPIYRVKLRAQQWGGGILNLKLSETFRRQVCANPTLDGKNLYLLWLMTTRWICSLVLIVLCFVLLVPYLVLIALCFVCLLTTDSTLRKTVCLTF